MIQDLQWFKDREMDTIIRVDRHGDETEKVISNEKEAEYYHSLPDSEFTFKAIVKIHRAAPGGCDSCEG